MHNTNIVLIPVKKANPTRAIHHYTPIQKMGYPDGVRCWCSGSLLFGVRESWSTRDRRRKAFFNQHDECEAPREGK